MKHVISSYLRKYIARIDRKDWKGMYTNTFLQFLLAFNQGKHGLRTFDYQYIDIATRWLMMLNANKNKSLTTELKKNDKITIQN